MKKKNKSMASVSDVIEAQQKVWLSISIKKSKSENEKKKMSLLIYYDKEWNDTNYATIAVDVESTGQYWDGKGKDVPFAIGWSSSGPLPAPGQVAIDLQIDDYRPLTKESMERLWLDRGYEYNCYKYFWSKNVDVFRDLQDGDKICLVRDEREMIQMYVNSLNFVLERTGKKLIQVFDTVCFDSAVFNYLRSKLDNCASMMYTPDSKHYVKSYEVDSMLYGLLQIPIGEAQELKYKQLKRDAKKWLVKRYYGEDEEGVAHTPEYDAKQILKLYLSIQAHLYYCKEKNVNAIDSILK